MNVSGIDIDLNIIDDATVCKLKGMLSVYIGREVHWLRH